MSWYGLEIKSLWDVAYELCWSNICGSQIPIASGARNAIVLIGRWYSIEFRCRTSLCCVDKAYTFYLKLAVCVVSAFTPYWSYKSLHRDRDHRGLHLADVSARAPTRRCGSCACGNTPIAYCTAVSCTRSSNPICKLWSTRPYKPAAIWPNSTLNRERDNEVTQFA